MVSGGLTVEGLEATGRLMYVLSKVDLILADRVAAMLIIGFHLDLSTIALTGGHDSLLARHVDLVCSCIDHHRVSSLSYIICFKKVAQHVRLISTTLRCILTFTDQWRGRVLGLKSDLGGVWLSITARGEYGGVSRDKILFGDRCPIRLRALSAWLASLHDALRRTLHNHSVVVTMTM